MTHLTDEQFEDILQGVTPPDHLATCQTCQARLAEKRALASRLRRAVNSLTPSAELEKGIRARISSNADVQTLKFSRYLQYFRSHRRIWATAVSAAAAALILVPLIIVSLAPQPAQAALVEIHEHNLSQADDFIAETDPNTLAAYFRDELGFDPQLPQLEHGLQLRGCCVRHFKGDIVGSYVVDTPEGIISVIIVNDLPQDLGKNQSRKDIGSHTYWQGHFAKCNIVSTRIHEYTYCAVGETDIDHLQNLLEKLLPENTSE